MPARAAPTTLGWIVGNRGFFPDHLCRSGRETLLQILAQEKLEVVWLGPDETKFGSIESLADAGICAELFMPNRERIDGVVVTLPNFGDERAIGNALRRAALDVAILVHAFPNDPGKMTNSDRRNSFCFKMSVCNNQVQYGIRFTLTGQHAFDPAAAFFRQDIRRFSAICRVVGGLRHARTGTIGARPAAFNTVHFSEKSLERAGTTVETLDLFEAFARAEHIDSIKAKIRAKLEEIKAYVLTRAIPAEALDRLARFGVVVGAWVQTNDLQATAIQCWTSTEEFYGVVPCALMNMMSNSLLPSARETDVPGVVGMLALQLASGKPSALVDWKNNYGTDPDKAVIFHCSSLPKEVFVDASLAPEGTPLMDYQQIIVGTVGKENTYETVVGWMRTAALTYGRVTTDDLRGRIAAYIGEGELTADPLSTFGGFVVLHVPGLQKLLHHICANGFEHHAAVNLSQSASAVAEALGKYLSWNVYHHGEEN